MREILFKAKRLDNGEWESGRIIHSERNISGEINECFICRGFADQADVVMIQVDPETVCQFTGLTDKNGNKIWENSHVKYTDKNQATIEGKIVFGTFVTLEDDWGIGEDSPKFCIEYLDKSGYDALTEDWEVIDPEILQSEK